MAFRSLADNGPNLNAGLVIKLRDFPGGLVLLRNHDSFVIFQRGSGSLPSPLLPPPLSGSDQAFRTDVFYHTYYNKYLYFKVEVSKF